MEHHSRMDETKTIAGSVTKARTFLARTGIDGEIAVADNGSTDGLQAMASPGQIRSTRKEKIRRHSELAAGTRVRWLDRAAFFHHEDLRYLKFLIPENVRVLELGCGTGHLLAALKPSFGVGVDFSEAMIDEARERYPGLSFRVGDIEDRDFIRSLPGPFDEIVMMDTLGSLDDCQAVFESLHCLCGRETRLVVVYFSHLWHPALKLAEAVHLRMPQLPQNVLSRGDVQAMASLAGFEPVKGENRLLSPVRVLGLGRLINRFIAPLPIIRNLCLRHYSVFRSPQCVDRVKSASVVVPARNEKGNIELAVKRIPRFTDDLEIIFVEGHSQDGTWDEIQRVAVAFPHYDIKAIRQPGRAKQTPSSPRSM